MSDWESKRRGSKRWCLTRIWQIDGGSWFCQWLTSHEKCISICVEKVDTYPGFCCGGIAVDVCCALESWRVQEAKILLQAFYCTFCVCRIGSASPCLRLQFFFRIWHFLSFTIKTHFVFCCGFCLPSFTRILSHPKISLAERFSTQTTKKKKEIRDKHLIY